MSRREFILLLGGVAASSLSARAQLRRIGVLIGYAETDSEVQIHIAAFLDEHSDYIRGRTLLRVGRNGVTLVCRDDMGRYFTVDVASEASQPVIDVGPYRLVRHPSYAGILLALFGFALTLGNWACSRCWSSPRLPSPIAQGRGGSAAVNSRRVLRPLYAPHLATDPLSDLTRDDRGRLRAHRVRGSCHHDHDGGVAE